MIAQKADPSEPQPYSVYPLTMAHPQFQASKPEPVPGTQVYDARGQITRQDYRGTPQRFPPVTVHSEDDEEYWKSKGYERAGKVDPSAWVRAHSDAPPANYVPQKYPLWRNGELIMTAQEDPEAGAEDLAPQPMPTAAPTPVQPSQEDNLRASMEELNRTMAAMQEQQRALAEENAKLKAEVEARTAEAPKRPGRPRKAA